MGFWQKVVVCFVSISCGYPVCNAAPGFEQKLFVKLQLASKSIELIKRGLGPKNIREQMLVPKSWFSGLNDLYHGELSYSGASFRSFLSKKGNHITLFLGGVSVDEGLFANLTPKVTSKIRVQLKNRAESLLPVIEKRVSEYQSPFDGVEKVGIREVSLVLGESALWTSKKELVALPSKWDGADREDESVDIKNLKRYHFVMKFENESHEWLTHLNQDIEKEICSEWEKAVYRTFRESGVNLKGRFHFNSKRSGMGITKPYFSFIPHITLFTLRHEGMTSDHEKISCLTKACRRTLIEYLAQMSREKLRIPISVDRVMAFQGG